MVVEIFWTGGYDSTFRICQLSRRDVTIHPFYMSDNRKSEEYELRAINTIREKLLSNPDTKAIIEPITYISVDDREHNDEVTNAFNELLKQDFMGSQYDWLGSFSLSHPGIELSIHKDDKAIELISRHGKLKEEDSPYGKYYVIDKDNSSKDLITLFGHEHFPLVNYTKLEMKKEYISMGLEDIMMDTWFCFTPIDGKPCGCCNPCMYTIEEGMSERFTPEALKRYHNRKNPILRTARKINNGIKKILPN